jgi:uncharacterized membrane protein YgdD (TMEM256/DUF423 family)
VAEVAPQVRWIAIAGVLGALAVAAGAFGAHGLRERLDPRQLTAWTTAAHYQLLHSIAILALGLFEMSTERSVRLPASLLTLGVLLFSGSIYLLTLTGLRFLGPVTPLGGLCLIAGWLSLLLLIRT